MGKKDAKAMAGMKVEFLEGAAAQGVDLQVAENVWELLLPFAGYAFNKAHAVCYSILAYQTAYLKANYPVEYMCALLSVYLSKEDRVTTCIEECRRLKIPVLPPDVNCSSRDFSIEGKKAIRFGLEAIKGVGQGVADGLIAERVENGRYTHLFEMCERTKAFGMNRIALEALVRAGALDSIDPNRNRLLSAIEGALQYAELKNRLKLAGQDSLFGGGSEPSTTSLPTIPECEFPTRSETLAMEKEVMGIYVSDHPLKGHERTIAQHATHSVLAALEAEENAFIKVAGVISKLRLIVTKSEGKKMATLVLEDFTGQIGAIAFPATYEKLRELMVKDSVVQISGYVMHRELRGEKSIEVRVEDIVPIEQSLELGYTGGAGAAGTLKIALSRATKLQLEKLKLMIAEHPGDYEVMIQILPETNHLPIFPGHHVSPNDNLVQALRQCLVRGDVSVEHRDSSARSSSLN